MVRDFDIGWVGGNDGGQHLLRGGPQLRDEADRAPEAQFLHGLPGPVPNPVGGAAGPPD